jgi:hypothetical protein
MGLGAEQSAARATTGWTSAGAPGDTQPMLPWNCLERLRDHFGDYVLVVTCRSCRHSRELTPAYLVRRSRNGWDEPLANIVARLRCRCGGKRLDVQVGFNRKPRGWTSNPS